MFPDVTTDAGLRTNLRAVERHLNEDHYVRGFSPGMFVTTESATQVIPASSARWSAVSFADGSTGRASVSFHKPSEWRTGHLAITFWYTSETSSTNNFRMNLVVEAIRNGEAWNAGITQLLAVTLDLPGPAAAPKLIVNGPTYTTTAFTPDDELFTLRFRRDGADVLDTNVTPLLLVYAKVEHLQGVRYAN
jgi:hypothetical protein